MATTSKKFVEEVRKQAAPEQTLSVARDIATEIHAQLTARQDVLMALVLTEAGVAASKVVSSPTAVAAFGIAATEGEVAAVGAVATDEGVVAAVATPVDESEAGETEDESDETA